MISIIWSLSTSLNLIHIILMYVNCSIMATVRVFMFPFLICFLHTGELSKPYWLYWCSDINCWRCWIIIVVLKVQGSRVTPVLGEASIAKMGDNKRMILIILIVPRFSQETACPYQSQHCLKVADFEGDDSRINLENPQKSRMLPFIHTRSFNATLQMRNVLRQLGGSEVLWPKERQPTLGTGGGRRLRGLFVLFFEDDCKVCHDHRHQDDHIDKYDDEWL